MSILKISLIFLFTALFITSFGRMKSTETGIASYYHDCFKGRTTANGEKYHPEEMTAAHLSLPFNTLVQVTNLNNDKQIVVRINDRGPFVNNRIIDLSRAAADSLGFIEAGLVKVKIKVITFDSLLDSVAKPLFARFLPRNIFSKDKSKKESKSTAINPKPLPVVSLSEGKNIVYGIQIGSFKERSNMMRMSDRLKDNYIEKFNVQEIQKGNALFYRMILGEYSDIKQAEELKNKINKEFPGCFIVRYNLIE